MTNEDKLQILAIELGMELSDIVGMLDYALGFAQETADGSIAIPVEKVIGSIKKHWGGRLQMKKLLRAFVTKDLAQDAVVFTNPSAPFDLRGGTIGGGSNLLSNLTSNLSEDSTSKYVNSIPSDSTKTQKPVESSKYCCATLTKTLFGPHLPDGTLPWKRSKKPSSTIWADWQSRVEELLGELPPIVQDLVKMWKEQRPKVAAGPRLLVQNFLNPLCEIRAELGEAAFLYGLQAAVDHSAANVKYIRKSAESHSGKPNGNYGRKVDSFEALAREQREKDARREPYYLYVDQGFIGEQDMIKMWTVDGKPICKYDRWCLKDERYREEFLACYGDTMKWAE
jgi:hypothetical protein